MSHVPRFILAVCFSAIVFAQQPVASYSRFCATCGLLGVDTIVTESGQFIVHSTGPALAPISRSPEAPPLIEAEPQLVAVTAERSKRAFIEQLGLPNTFHDKVHVVILPRARPEQPIGLVSAVHSDGFQYQIGIPGYVESSRMIKALVQAILQEYANRGAHRNAELPSWLVEGMQRQLLSSLGSAPVLNRKPMTVERFGYDRLGDSRRFLQTNAPITIQELSFNNLEKLSPLERQKYESSAHLLVYELLQLRGGPALMSQFVQTLPQAMNWQTAFFAVYRQFFRTPLDLEKWWMLRCVAINNQQARQNWSTEVSLDRLESLLRTSTEVRLSTNAIPERREVTLQQVLGSMDFGIQKEILGQKLQQIFFISANLSPEVAPVAAAYEQAIESYLEKRALGDYQPALKSDPEQRVQSLVKSTIKTFDELDQGREEVRAGRAPKLPEPPRPSRTPGRQILVTGASARK